MRLGIIKVGFHVLADLLHLPEGHSVRAVRDVEGDPDAFEVCVEGPTLAEVAPGSITPIVDYQVSVTETGNLVREKKITGKFLQK